jgi:catechol 2,3-dioxygenase-like lactoylglutathione lyase family enzyme
MQVADPRKLLPMTSLSPVLHVADIDRTAAWYVDLGFELIIRDQQDAIGWAQLTFDGSRLILCSDASTPERLSRHVDLYFRVPDLAALVERIGDRFPTADPPAETFYGMREFVVRDPNDIRITFAEAADWP